MFGGILNIHTLLSWAPVQEQPAPAPTPAPAGISTEILIIAVVVCVVGGVAIGAVIARRRYKTRP